MRTIRVAVRATARVRLSDEHACRSTSDQQPSAVTPNALSHARTTTAAAAAMVRITRAARQCPDTQSLFSPHTELDGHDAISDVQLEICA